MKSLLFEGIELPLGAMPGTGHNRWHEGIPPLATIGPGEIVELAVRDSGDRQVVRSTTLAEYGAFDIDRCHPLSGPLFVETVEPDDFLEVTIVDIECESFGWSSLIPGAPGLLADFVTEPFLARWTIEGGLAWSEDVPGISVRGRPFLGVIGVAPSTGQRLQFAKAEAEYAAGGGAVLLPGPASAQPSTPAIAREGLRTMPGRASGGNLDITDLVAGSKVLLPVGVPGALLSIGDVHFSQGDGEAPGLAIEVGASVRLSCRGRKAADLGWRPTHPVVLTAVDAAPRHPGPCVIATGVSTDLDGTCHGFDLGRALRRALLEIVNYLVDARGYTRAQALTITSVAVDLRVNALGNAPGVVASAVLPLDIFDSGQ